MKFRKATAADIPFVVDSWTDSYRTAHAAGMLSMDPLPQPLETTCECGTRRAVIVDYGYDMVMRVNVNAVIARPGVEVWMAYDPKEPKGTELLGWIAVEKGIKEPRRVRENSEWITKMVTSPCPAVHYIYVKDLFRHHGIARALFKKAGVDPTIEFFYSCKTPVATDLKAKIPHGRWMPLLPRYKRAD